MRANVNRLCKRFIRATLALALTVPFRAFADFGYEFHKVFSLEAVYVDHGKHYVSVSTTVRERGPFIEALVRFIASESFSPFLKGGVHRLKVETHPPVQTQKERNTDLTWDAGLNFNICKHMGLRFEWERFRIENHDTDLVFANIVHYFR